MGFKLFSFDWFTSAERKELNLLKIKEQQLKNEILEKQLEEKAEKPYKKLIFSNNTITAVLKGGITLSKANADMALFLEVKNAVTEGKIISLLSPTPEVTASPVEVCTKEEMQLVKKNIGILENHPDFTFSNGNTYLKGVALPIAPIVLASFIELCEKLHPSYLNKYPAIELEEQYEALKMFWRWTALNPIESSRNDLMSFIKKNDIIITKNGLLELYRRVVSVGSKDKALSKFVSEQYFKIKKAKKGPKNYTVGKRNDEYKLFKNMEEANDSEGIWVNCGNLADLYIDLPNLEENIYTDGHTRTKEIRVGQVYKEDEDKIDLDNSKSCSAGLHVGSRSFGFSGFGDTGVVALVNPMKVRSVPNHECNKMRVSEMFIAAVVELQDYSEHVDSGEINDYSQEYFNTSVEELEKELENKNFSILECQSNITPLAIKDVISIKDALKERIVKI